MNEPCSGMYVTSEEIYFQDHLREEALAEMNFEESLNECEEEGIYYE